VESCEGFTWELLELLPCEGEEEGEGEGVVRAPTWTPKRTSAGTSKRTPRATRSLPPGTRDRDPGQRERTSTCSH